jgi:hypothetical protein
MRRREALLISAKLKSLFFLKFYLKCFTFFILFFKEKPRVRFFGSKGEGLPFSIQIIVYAQRRDGRKVVSANFK